MAYYPSTAPFNHWCQQHAINLRFLSVAQMSPRLESLGMQPLSGELKRRALDIQASLRVDEWHALVDLSLARLPTYLPYRILRYSEMLAMRELGLQPTGLAATVLIQSAAPVSLAQNGKMAQRAEQPLLWQRRSVNSHLFPGYLSLLGGGFNPFLNNSAPGDHNSAERTAVRECLEESNLSITIQESAWVVITQETDTGAVQINYLGIQALLQNMQADEQEGALVILPPPMQSEIPRLLEFTDLAKGCLYAWRSL